MDFFQKFVILRRFLQDNELFKNYKGTIEKYFADGHARRVSFEELHVKDRSLWYVPHHHDIHSQQAWKDQGGVRLCSQIQRDIPQGPPVNRTRSYKYSSWCLDQISWRSHCTVCRHLVYGPPDKSFTCRPQRVRIPLVTNWRIKSRSSRSSNGRPFIWRNIIIAQLLWFFFEEDGRR